MIRWSVLIILCVLVLVACSDKPTSQAFTVAGKSMEPTFHAGQVVTIVSTDPTLLHRGDVVLVAPSDKNTFLKRIIGLPGDTVSVRDGHVYVNDALQNEPYVSSPSTDCTPGEKCVDVRVLPGSVFVLGDNRWNSSDSREFGSVPLSQIKGQVK